MIWFMTYYGLLINNITLYAYKSIPNVKINEHSTSNVKNLLVGSSK